MNEEIITPEIEIIRYFNETTGRKAREIKSNLTPIKARLKEGYTIEEIKNAILLKTIEWKNDPVMSQHLCIDTIFRPKKLEKYVNQVEAIKENPKLYAKYFAKLTKPRTRANNADDLTAMYGE